LVSGRFGPKRVGLGVSFYSGFGLMVWKLISTGTDETFLGALTASSGNIKEFTRGIARNLQALA